jgi:hypothetical protein
MFDDLLKEIDFGKDLRWLLVSTLYAFAIAEIAVQSARLVDHKKRSVSGTFAVVAHLIMVTIVVTTSWVGWTIAVARDPHPAHHLMIVFSSPFCLLLIDVGLVICYFIMAKLAGIPESKHEPLSPSAGKASFWLMIVFGGYVVWGVIAHFVMHGWLELSLLWPSVACFALAIVSWALIRSLTAFSAMVFADAGMAALVLMFRASKLGWIDSLYWTIAGVLAVSFLVCLCVATVLDRRSY